jgi:hypothetical protein
MQRYLVQVSLAGAVTPFVPAAAGIIFPYGVAWDPLSSNLFVGDQTGNAVYQV